MEVNNFVKMYFHFTNIIIDQTMSIYLLIRMWTPYPIFKILKSYFIITENFFFAKFIITFLKFLFIITLNLFWEKPRYHYTIEDYFSFMKCSTVHSYMHWEQFKFVFSRNAAYSKTKTDMPFKLKTYYACFQ